MQRRVAAEGKPAAPGIIETIASGLSLALAFPWLLAVPVLLDLYLSLGVRVSPAALADAGQRWLAEADQSALAGDVEPWVRGADLTELVAVFVPSLLVGVDRADLAAALAVVAAPPTWWLVGLAAVGLVVAGAVLGALYQVPLAYAVRRDRMTVAAVARSAGLASVRLLALLLVLIGAVLVIAGPAALAAAFLLVGGVDVVPLLTLALAALGIVAYVYLFFVLDAIVVSEVGPIRAALLSIGVVRRNFWQAVGFQAASLLIGSGLARLWEQFVGSAPGLLLGIVGNAFIVTGLVLASMVFYRDRLRRWRPEQGTAA